MGGRQQLHMCATHSINTHSIKAFQHYICTQLTACRQDTLLQRSITHPNRLLHAPLRTPMSPSKSINLCLCNCTSVKASTVVPAPCQTLAVCQLVQLHCSSLPTLARTAGTLPPQHSLVETQMWHTQPLAYAAGPVQPIRMRFLPLWCAWLGLSGWIASLCDLVHRLSQAANVLGVDTSHADTAVPANTNSNAANTSSNCST